MSPSLPVRGPLLLGLREAARRLGVGRDRMAELVGQGRIPAGQLGERRVVLAADVDRFAAELVGEGVLGLDLAPGVPSSVVGAVAREVVSEGRWSAAALAVRHDLDADLVEQLRRLLIGAGRVLAAPPSLSDRAEAGSEIAVGRLAGYAALHRAVWAVGGDAPDGDAVAGALPILVAAGGALDDEALTALAVEVLEVDRLAEALEMVRARAEGATS